MADEDFLCNDEATASNHTSVVVALIVLEGTGFGLGALFIFACCCQLVFIDKLKNLWQIIQFQVWRNPESGFSLFFCLIKLVTSLYDTWYFDEFFHIFLDLFTNILLGSIDWFGILYFSMQIICFKRFVDIWGILRGNNWITPLCPDFPIFLESHWKCLYLPLSRQGMLPKIEPNRIQGSSIGKVGKT